MKSKFLLAAVIFLVLAFGLLYFSGSFPLKEIPPKFSSTEIVLNPEGFHDGSLTTMSEQLRYRIDVQPFNLIAFIIFVLAIIHTFFANSIANYAEKKKEEIKKDLVRGMDHGPSFHNRHSIESFGVEMLRFCGEVEVIFGLWVIPLVCIMTYMYDWHTTIDYLSNRNYVEPAFVVIMMALASTAPIVKFAEMKMQIVAKLGGDTVSAWWLTIMIVGTLLGSFITEPAAMTLAALLLQKHFYHYKPTPKLAYATLGLLFTNISVGGVLTNFSAPPVLLVAREWQWDTLFVLQTFGLKAVLGILIATGSYFFIFKKEFKLLQENKEKSLLESDVIRNELPIPLWIMLVNVAFLIWIVFTGHYPAIFIGSFALFVGFHKATQLYQKRLELKAPLLVGFFLAGLVVHGSLQGWWIAPLLTRIHQDLLMVISLTLTAFNDNASITYLASLIPNLSDSIKYAVMSGAIAGGGVTVIANAPNPAGQALLGRYFEGGIAPLKLFLAAFFPTLVMVLCFYLLK